MTPKAKHIHVLKGPGCVFSVNGAYGPARAASKHIRFPEPQTLSASDIRQLAETSFLALLRLFDCPAFFFFLLKLREEKCFASILADFVLIFMENLGKIKSWQVSL